MSEKYVWEFTNQKKLTKSEFIDYFERKVFKTIRKYEMLPENRKIKMRSGDDINTSVLTDVLKGKFNVEFSVKGKFLSENLSEVAEEIFRNILKGNYGGPKPKDKFLRPLFFLSDSEIELYAKLAGIKGRARNKDYKIRSLIDRFIGRNQDLEINIVKAFEQIRKN
jgi:hypothetical protein